MEYYILLIKKRPEHEEHVLGINVGISCVTVVRYFFNPIENCAFPVVYASLELGYSKYLSPVMVQWCACLHSNAGIAILWDEPLSRVPHDLLHQC